MVTSRPRRARPSIIARCRAVEPRLVPVQVDHVQRRSGDQGRGEHLLEGVRAALRLLRAVVAQVDVHRRAGARGLAEDLEDLEARGRRACTGFPFRRPARLGRGRPGWRSGSRRGERRSRAGWRHSRSPGGGRRFRVPHDGHPHRDVPDAGPEMDQGLSLAVGIEAIHVGGPDLQLERGGDAVGGAQGVVLGVLAVGVQVDEPRRHHEAVSVDRGPAAQRVHGDGGDLPRRDADVGRHRYRFRGP